jgi:hypothetical protein
MQGHNLDTIMRISNLVWISAAVGNGLVTYAAKVIQDITSSHFF